MAPEFFSIVIDWIILIKNKLPVTNYKILVNNFRLNVELQYINSILYQILSYINLRFNEYKSKTNLCYNSM